MKKPRIHHDDAPGGLTHNPFAALRPAGSPSTPPEAVPQPGGVAPVESPEAEPEPARVPSGHRVLVQREKKGRAGKTVTRVTGCRLAPAELSDLARRLKRALGCGASVEGTDILLQGALTERAATWLRKELGVQVTIGN